MSPDELITVVVPTSPVSSNPDIENVEAVLKSIRRYLPLARVLITADGVRPEQRHLTGAYLRYLHRIQYLIDTVWDNVYLWKFDKFTQQTGMLRSILAEIGIDTPIVFYVEHDMELISELPIPAICDGILSGDVDVMRLTYNTDLEPCHKHMRLEEEAIDIHGVPAVRTWQWSQNPHFASTNYYRRIVRDHFADRCTYIEFVMLGVLSEGWVNRGMDSWNEHKVWIYKPWGNTQRCMHLDGRKGDPVYDEQGRAL